MGGGKGGRGGGTATPPKSETKAPQAAEESSAALRALQEQMAEQQRNFQEMFMRQQEEAEKARIAAEERAAEAKRANAYSSIDVLMTSRMEAEETAITSVDEEIEKERAEADLRAVDFTVTEDQRKERIQKQFEEYWDVRYERELSDLVSKYGDPEMEEAQRLAVERGEATAFWDPDTKHSGFKYVPPKPISKKPPVGEEDAEGSLITKPTELPPPPKKREEREEPEERPKPGIGTKPVFWGDKPDFTSFGKLIKGGPPRESLLR